MNTTKIDITNIGLLILACAVAYVIPFELFLFSYAVLGPLHYLTEITWLKKRDCFATGKRDYIFLVAPCIVLAIMVLVTAYKQIPAINNIYGLFVSFFGENFMNFTNVIIFTAFASALAFVIFRDWLYKLIFILVALFAGVILQDSHPFLLFFGIFLPTIIHVFVFTGLFMIYGALKNRSASGIAAAVVFVMCASVFFIWRPEFHFYSVTDYARKAIFMDGRGFIALNAELVRIFNMGKVSMEIIFQSPVGLSVGRFIAFAYTYHYLNWFSKTEVIKWHLVPAKWLAAVIALWVFSVVLYVYDYKTGLMALYFLSMLHVFLEFPLNYRSVIGIWEETTLIAGLRKPVVVKSKPAGAAARKK